MHGVYFLKVLTDTKDYQAIFMILAVLNDRPVAEGKPKTPSQEADTDRWR